MYRELPSLVTLEKPTPILATMNSYCRTETANARNEIARKILRVASALPVILLVALLLRLGDAWAYQRPRSPQALSTIPFLLEPGNIAYALAVGKGFSSPFRADTGPTAWTTPAYPLLVAGIFRLFGVYTFPSYVASVLANILFSTLACAPLFLVGKRIAGGAVAAIAAWLWAVCPNAITFTVSIWDVSLSALLAAAILWATLALPESPGVHAWMAYGLLWGFAAMTNATLVALLPFLLAWLAYRTRWLMRPAIALAVAVLCCVPWTIRNYAVFHAFIPLRSVMGLQLWMGNNEQTRGRWAGALHPIDNSADRARYVQRGEVAYMQEKKQEALRFMLADPWREAGLMGKRFVVFWSGGSQHPIDDFWESHSLRVRGLLLFNLLAALGALGGIVALIHERNQYAFPAVIFPIVYPLAAYLTLASARYRLPIDPAVLLLTAVAIKKWGPPWRRPPTT